MPVITTEIGIDATPDRVWQVLVDLPRWSEWNPFIRQASGDVAAGSTLRLRMFPSEGRPMTFRPTVLRAEEGRELRWIGRLVLPGLFDGEHSFVLRSDGDGTLVTQSERFAGLLVPFARRIISGTEANFRALNEALKARVEHLSDD